jgi:hypothetical protein
MPGWVYLSAVFWPKLWKDDSRGWRWATWILIPLFAVFSTWIHVVQAGNNMWTVVWHQRPHKDQFPDYFWNVRFPQWLASEKQVVAMEAWHETVFMGVVIANIPVENLEAQPGRWGTLEGTYEYWRWSIGRSATIEWKGWPDSAYRPERSSLGIDANVYLDQSIGVFVNDEQVGRINSRANEGRLLFRMDAFPVDPSVPLRIEFRMNNPKIPAVEHAGESADNRELGIQLFNVVIFSR